MVRTGTDNVPACADAQTTNPTNVIHKRQSAPTAQRRTLNMFTE
jgi:hypothetical protein